MNAASRGYLDIMTMLLDSGVSPHADYNTRSALEEAARVGYSEAVKLLLERSTEVATFLIQDALCHAAAQGHAKIVEILLDHGASIDAEGESLSPLSLAVKNGRIHVVEILLKRGAFP